MSNKQTVGARIPPDTFEEFENYRETRDLNKSTAGARLIEVGLEEETSEEETGPKPVADVLREMGLASLAFTLISTLVSPEWVVIVLGVVAASLLVASAGYRWRAGQ